MTNISHIKCLTMCSQFTTKKGKHNFPVVKDELHMPKYSCRDQKTTFRNWFCTSAMGPEG